MVSLTHLAMMTYVLYIAPGEGNSGYVVVPVSWVSVATMMSSVIDYVVRARVCLFENGLLCFFGRWVFFFVWGGQVWSSFGGWCVDGATRMVGWLVRLG